MMRDAEKTIGNLIDKQAVAYLSAVDEDGCPATRAMLAPRVREGLHIFYFTTNTSSQKVALYRKNPNACVYFCDKRWYRGVCLQGMVEVMTDQETKNMIWLPGDTLYYPGGVTDADYCVLKFTARAGRYYSKFRSEDFAVE